MDFLFYLVLLSLLPLTFSLGRKYEYDHKRHKGRTTLPPPGFPKLTKWSGSGPVPKIPGDDWLYGWVKIVAKAGEPCGDYFRQERGKYQDTNDNNKVKWVYPFKSWVKSCDVSRFLWCKESKCVCWPGKYWDNERQTCVSGFEQSCDKFEAMTFRIDQQCGFGMECVDKPSAPGSKFCICYRESTKYSYRTPEKDAFGNDKFECSEERALGVDEDCHEYRALRWHENPPGTYELMNVTHTGCGDTDGYGVEENYYCKFPKQMTGKTPKSNGTAVKYGQRTGGKCACTDWQLGYQAGTGRGCIPRAGIHCSAAADGNKEGSINITHRGTKWNSKKLTFQIRGCGELAECVGLGQGHLGNCKCKSRHNGQKVGIDTVSKTCMVGAVTGMVGGLKKKVGETCHAYLDPCVTGEGQVCENRTGSPNATCVCGRGYIEEDKECRGQYGVPCASTENCATDKGFNCTEVPELALIDEEFIANETYCVCENEYLYSESGFCGASNLQLHSIQIVGLALILTLKFLGVGPLPNP